jgi:hypothetical protein
MAWPKSTGIFIAYLILIFISQYIRTLHKWKLAALLLVLSPSLITLDQAHKNQKEVTK